mgnify:CR=1 FL=1
MTRRKFIFGALYCLSFIFLIIHLNFNVRTFRLTQDLQDITLQIYDVSFDVEEKELDYLSRTNLEEIYNYVTNQLGMVRQDRINVFSNQSVSIR